ncbi:hypothetical protein D6D24_07604 [Aureobasidium pullulans]|uniref:Uncharacterized protein n=1 Tax=Aureobasidium pullulans TaxID=5580 RepID=A0A4S8VHP6_AURPU|nr:hypothetical protein D6D24_07604 [Aureobasidium pullulans]
MDSFGSHEEQHSVAQFNLPNSDSRSANIHSQVTDIAVEKFSLRFHDFIAPNPANSNASIWIKGSKAPLNDLASIVSEGGTVQRNVRADQEVVAYTPLVTAINSVCARHGLFPITEYDLIHLQREHWFDAFAKQFLKKYRAERSIDYTSFYDMNAVTGDRMVLLLEALEFARRLPKIALGVVIHNNGSQPWVTLYPCPMSESPMTAWVLVEPNSTGNRYYGIGVITTQQVSEPDMEEETEHAAPTPAPRKTAARILALQAPLAAGTSIDDILDNHPELVHYVNLLKVGLRLSNKDIAKRLGFDYSSVIVKRMTVAVDYIESEFDIDQNCFRTLYDRERKAAEVATRGKDEASEQALTANEGKIAQAMAWIKAGGPRPTRTTAGAHAAPFGRGVAPPPTMNPGPFPRSYTAPTSRSVTQDATMAYHGAPLGYAPASHLPFDQQNLPDARGPAVQRISTGFNSTDPALAVICGALKKQSIQSYYAEAFIDHFSFDKIDNLMGDRMVLLLEALEFTVPTNKQLTKSIQVTPAALREFCPAAEEAMVPATIVYDQKTYDKRRRSVPVSDCRARAYKIDPLYMMYLQMALSTHVRKVIMTT